MDSLFAVLPSGRSARLSPGQVGLLSFVLSCLLVAQVQAQPHGQVSTQEPATSAAAPSSPSAPADTGVAAAPLDEAAQTTRARDLFQQGNQLAESGDYAAASARYREALALREAPAVEYNLAAALSELHEYNEAYNRTQNVLANAETPASVQERAKQLESSLLARVARLTVVTSGSDSSLEVSVDGAVLDPRLMGRAQAVSPGAHEIVATRDGKAISSRTVEIPMSTAALVDVSLVVTEREGESASMKVSTSNAILQLSPAPTPKDDGSKRKRRVWIGIAAGIVAVGAGVGLGIALAGNEASHQEALQGDTGVLTW